MNKKINSLFSLLFLFSVCGCNNDVSSSISSSIVNKPKNELEIALLKLQDNNFSIDYYDSYVNNNNIERKKSFRFTAEVPKSVNTFVTIFCNDFMYNRNQINI